MIRPPPGFSLRGQGRSLATRTMCAYQNRGRMTAMLCSLSLMSRSHAFMPVLVHTTNLRNHPRCTHGRSSLQPRHLFDTPISGMFSAKVGTGCNRVFYRRSESPQMALSFKPEPSGENADVQGEPVWYADGLSFRCTMCGHCCSGFKCSHCRKFPICVSRDIAHISDSEAALERRKKGSVQFTEDEAQGMATKVGVSVKQFYNQYTKKLADGSFQLKEVYKKKHGFDCVFLDRKTMKGKAICSLYEARPKQCRTWPFWPENLASPEDWEEAGEECPGINTGKLRGLEEIEKAMEHDGRS